MTRDELLVALRPTVDSLLGTARAAAQAVLEQAHAGAAVRIAGARSQADEIRRQAVSDGRAAAEDSLEISRRQARRDARQRLLEARSAAYEELTDRTLAAALRLRTDPRYPELMRALEDIARSRLGEAAVVREAPSGGVIAELDDRWLDLSLASRAQQAVQACAAEVAALWE